MPQRVAGTVAEGRRPVLQGGDTMLREERHHQLRDEMAAGALQALLAKTRDLDDARARRDRLAAVAYELADAMLEARERVAHPTSLRPPSTPPVPAPSAPRR
ncbi:MAG TPA: hypothetical protein RMF84_04450 [Polyangiaceae bacterium LLY-WYZ-14_1]|nr:hypothetical protein [Polyangiaceae bacterium LLY-WYZ-14_1]